MSFDFVKKLPIPKEVKEQFPLSEQLKAIKEEKDRMIRDVFTGKSDKFIVIIGPCSADHEDPVCEYVTRLAKVQEEVKDKLILIPRIYTNKPRTTGAGYQPDPEKKPDLFEGVLAIRKLHMRAIQETGLTPADEMLYPENYWYLADVLSYVAVGARSVENQQHRLTVSGMDVPAGMKNPTSGDFSVMMNSVVAGQSGHTFIFRSWEVNTPGNPLTHTVLRGYTNQYGRNFPNYHYEDLIRLHDLYEEKGCENPACIVDANHSNSNKQFKEQIRIVKDVLHSCHCSGDVRKLVKGVMIESYLEEGCQSIHEHDYGKSITDPCLGWEDSKRLLYELHKY